MMLSQGLKENKKKKISIARKSPVKGNLPESINAYKKPGILKINTILAYSLIPAILTSMISYLGVIAKENRVKDLHFLTNKLNYENIELQNRVDYLKSFYTIEDKVQKIDFLKKADKVMEVPRKSKKPVLMDNKQFFQVTSVPGY